ncbi:MAG: hypothetical protein HY362_01585 [Candidatus Aenigmarchaeota archaeon]|nr:hypothetical protein [Candidatus Aenigmarchaeota archaeon]
MDPVEIAKAAAIAEIKKHGLPSQLHLDLSLSKAIELAEELGADRLVVELGTILMDFKLGEATSLRKKEEHAELSVAAAEKLLHGLLDSEKLGKVLACIKEHHLQSFSCIESEICANADCYRFLSPRGFLSFLHSLGNRKMSFNDSIVYVEEKADEKWEILSLPQCKEELEPFYRQIEEFIRLAKA